MPIYEYRCNSCDQVFARLQAISVSRTDPTPCPECGSEDTERLFSSFAAGSTTSAAAPCGGPPSCGAGGGG